MRSKVTITDVAREAKVSTQTVSRVLNNKGEIRPETRQLVLEVIERLDYRPSPIARGMASSRMSTIGVVVPDIGNPFFADVVRGAESVAREHGFQIFLCNTDQEPEREAAAFNALKDMWVDGIVLCSARLPDERLYELLAHGPAVVLVNHEPVEGAVGCVRLDEQRSARLLTDHLISRGRHRLVKLAGRPGGPAYRARRRGFVDALEAAGMPVEDHQIVFCTTNPEGGYKATTELLQKAEHEVDALVCFNDLVAIGAMRACLEQGVDIPEDIAVVASGDTVLAGMMRPSLTALRRPVGMLGKHAVTMLLQHNKGSEYPSEVVLESELIIRESAP